MDIKKIRQSKGLNQLQFWTPIGVTQSGGSRYETDRPIPIPVQILIQLAYGTKPQRRAMLKRLGL